MSDPSTGPAAIDEASIALADPSTPTPTAASAAATSPATPAPDSPRPTDAAAPIAESLAPDPTQVSDPVSRLTPAQQLALHHLAAGASIRDAASGAGVGRRTMHR